ncbi:MAG: chemotaxis response regulator protein-glutamate methylesterase [Acuticoccus sp.]
MNVDAPARPRAGGLEIDLLSQSLSLRTALRRAVNGAGEGFVLSVPGTLSPGAGGGTDGGARRALVVDADQPGLTGAALFQHIAAAHEEMPVVVVARDTMRGRGLQKQVLKAGARAFFLLPESQQPRDLKAVAHDILAALRGEPVAAAPRPTGPATATPALAPGAAPPPPVTPRRLGFIRPKVIVVGSSTGGPQALLALFKAFHPTNVTIPVLIVQHMPAAFTHILAEHITRATGWRAAEASDGEALTPGEIRIAPGGKHLEVGGSKSAIRLRLTEDEPVNFCRPSADVLFMSAAALFGGAVLGVVLTGMGHDGAAGVKAIKGAGGAVFAQDEESSVVWGMPGAAVATGVVDQVLPLDGFAPALTRAISGVL